MIQRYVSLGLLSIVVCASQASAQRFTLRRVPTYESEISVSLSVMSPASVTFGNLGTIDSLFNTAGAYGDFDAGKDSSYTDADGNPRDSDGRTYNFTFKDLMQVVDQDGNPAYDGNYIAATAIEAKAQSGNFANESEGEANPGWNLQYTRYLNDKRKFGFTVGIGTSGVHTDQSAEWDALITSRTDLYKGYNVAGRDGYTGGYNRPHVYTPSMPNVYVDLEPFLSLDPQTLTDPVKATGTWELDAAFYTFRLGAAYNIELTRRWNMRVSGGLSALYVGSNFRWNESVTAKLDTGDMTAVDNGRESKTSFLWGGWADLGAHYAINSRSTFFSSVEYQTASGFDQTTSNGHRIEFDTSNMIYAKSGFSWAF